MPQMKPMNWMLMMISFNMLYINFLMTLKNHMKMTKNNELKKMNKYWSW